MENHSRKETIIKLISDKNINNLKYENHKNIALEKKIKKGKFRIRKNKQDINYKIKKINNNKSFIFLLNLIYLFLFIFLTKESKYKKNIKL